MAWLMTIDSAIGWTDKFWWTDKLGATSQTPNRAT
jgi:hypothetical protein